MKVYVVIEGYDNGESFEDNISGDKMLDIFSTREKALDYILNYKGEEEVELWVTEPELDDLFKKYDKELIEEVRKEHTTYLKYGGKASFEEYKEKLHDGMLRYLLSNVVGKNVCLIEEDRRKEVIHCLRLVYAHGWAYTFNIEEMEVK